MQLSEDNKRVVLALIWSLKPSDLSVLQAVLSEPADANVATTRNSANSIFYSQLESLSLAEGGVEDSSPHLSMLKTFRLTAQGKEEIPPLMDPALNSGVPPQGCIVSAEVVRILNLYAQEGNAPSQTKLAILYDNGQGVEQNYSEALKWYGRAADQGDTTACNNLGVMHFGGFGVPRNLDEARRWFLKAAELGSPGAMDNLGEMFSRGLGVAQDNTEALKWFRKAAALGHEAARRKAEAHSQR